MFLVFFNVISLVILGPFSFGHCRMLFVFVFQIYKLSCIWNALEGHMQSIFSIRHVLRWPSILASDIKLHFSFLETKISYWYCSLLIFQFYMYCINILCCKYVMLDYIRIGGNGKYRSTDNTKIGLKRGNS